MKESPVVNPSADVCEELWEASDEDDSRYLALLREQGYAESRLARQVYLLVCIRTRSKLLGWASWPSICGNIGVSYETLRKFRHMVRATRQHTVWLICDGMGWTRDSFEAVMGGGEPTVLADWQPYSERHGQDKVDQRRGVFQQLGLEPGDLDDVLRRYDMGDAPTRQLAAAIGRTLSEDIDTAYRDLLLSAARAGITRRLQDERGSATEIDAALDKIGQGRADTAERIALS